MFRKIIEQIRQKVAVAATDAAMEGNYMVTHWVVSTENNNEEWIGGIQNTQWSDGLIPAGEGLGLLDLIKNINNNVKHLTEGEITIYNDNKKLI